MKTYTINIENVSLVRENVGAWNSGDTRVAPIAEGTAVIRVKDNLFLCVGVRQIPEWLARDMGYRGARDIVIYQIEGAHWTDADTETSIEQPEEWAYSGEKLDSLLNRIVIEGMERIHIEGDGGVYFA